MPITEYQTWTSTTIKKSLDRNMNNFNENLTNSKPIICIIYGKVCLPSYILSWFPTAHWCQLNFLLLIIQWCAWWTRLIPACYEIYGCESTLIVDKLRMQLTAWILTSRSLDVVCFFDFCRIRLNNCETLMLQLLWWEPKIQN
mgnify:CR=1 FL=1